MKIQYKITCLFLIVCCICIFIFVNFFNESKPKNNIITTKYITTKALSSDVIFSDIIFINEKKENVNVKTYNSYLGFTLDYILEYFNITNLSNNTIILTSLNDSNTFLKIEKIAEIDYYKDVDILDEQLENGYYKKYSFIKGKDLFIKITKSILNKNDYLEKYNVSMNYTINSIRY